MDEDKKPDSPASDTVIVGNFEVAMHLTQHRTIKMMGYVYAGDTPQIVNGRLDRFQDSLDRQYVRADMVNKKAQRAQMVAGLDQGAIWYEQLVAEKAALAPGKRLPTNKQKQIDDHSRLVESQRVSIATLDANIAAAEKVLAEQ